MGQHPQAEKEARKTEEGKMRSMRICTGGMLATVSLSAGFFRRPLSVRRLKGPEEEKLSLKLIMAQLPQKTQVTRLLPQTPGGTNAINNPGPSPSTQGMQGWSLLLRRGQLFRNRFGKVIFGT